MLISYRKADYAHAMQSLLPRGRAWVKNTDGVRYKLLTALSAIYERNTSRAIYLVRDVFPATSTETLPEWEKTVGLPSLCSGLAETLQERRNQVVSRLISSGGQSAQYYINFARSIGRDIKVKNHAPFRCGTSKMGDALGNTDWFFTWSITSTQYNITYFRTGVSAAGEPLRSWGDRYFECELRNIMPSHTVLIFQYVD